MEKAPRDNETVEPARPMPGDTAVRLGPWSGVVEVMRELGVDPDPVFAGSGYSIGQFTDPDSVLPYATASRFLARCIAATQCPHIGLLVGKRSHPSALGLAGFLLRNCPDVGTALRGFVQNLDLHDQGGTATLVTENDFTQLGYTIHQADIEAAEHIQDASIAVACNIMRSLCGEKWNPTEVLLSRRPPPDTRPYRRFYRAPVRFDADVNAIVFASHWLDQPIPDADVLLHRHLQREADALHQQQKGGIVSDVRRQLRKSLLSGNCRITDIAGQLCLHERTLHRRLNREGTSFRAELDAIRQEIARRLLAGSSMPVARIAANLGYSSVNSFSRAFKRWTGCSPAHWRAVNAAPGEPPTARGTGATG